MPTATTARASTLSITEALTVAAICFGLSIVVAFQAMLGGFPDAKFSAASNAWGVTIEFLLAAAALLYLHVRGFDITSLYPQPSLNGTLSGLLLFCGAWLLGTFAIWPFYDRVHPQLIDVSYHGSLIWVVVFAMANGTFEEIFLLGVLVRGLRGFGLSVAIGLPLLIRILYHVYQGPLGVVWVLTFGMFFSLTYIRKAQLWPPVLAHILWDIVPFIVRGI